MSPKIGSVPMSLLDAFPFLFQNIGVSQRAWPLFGHLRAIFVGPKGLSEQLQLHP